MNKGQRTVCLSRAFVTSPQREVVISVARVTSQKYYAMHVRNNLWEKDNHMSEFIQIWALFFGAIYTRWDLSLDSLFSYVISRAYFRQTSVIRVHPVLGPRLRLFVKIFYMKLKCNFKKFLLKKLMECPVTALIESRLKSTGRFSQRACR